MRIAQEARRVLDRLVGYDLSGYDIEGTWQITQGDSDDTEIGFPHDAGDHDDAWFDGDTNEDEADDTEEPDEMTEEEREAIEILEAQSVKATNSGGYNDNESDKDDDEYEEDNDEEDTLLDKLKRLFGIGGSYE